MTDQRQRPLNDPHDGYERPRTYNPLLRQDQQQSYEYNRTIAPSRPSSSSGSGTHTLRRSPRIDDIRAPRHRRSQSLDSATLSRDIPASAFGSAIPSHTSNTHFKAHRAVRISQRTASAVLYALEEALRIPNEFTTDLEELNAQMSDLGARGGNGYAHQEESRTAGREQVVQPSLSSGALRMQDIARSAEDRQRRRIEEERRKATERRAAAAAPGRTNVEQRRAPAVASSTQYVPLAEPTMSTKTPARPSQQAYPTPSTSESAELKPEGYGRTRATSRATEEPRPIASQPTSTTRRAQPATTGMRQSSAPATTAPATSISAQDGASDSKQVRNTASSFPHAFERWENLSAHWEGLTSYWIHKLESNQEQLAKSVPTASAMSRQITDLSAAGANLFHAVVELQRLRASSERKFQRWFFETKTEQEHSQEELASLRKALEAEKAARRESQAEKTRALNDKQAADILVKDMRRELHISKEEARRAWEELGRREQEERDRIISLREGKPTVVGEVQVVPMHASQGSRSEGLRTVLNDEAQYQSQFAQGQGEPFGSGYSYEEGASPTDTDPFSEAARAQTARRGSDLPPFAATSYQPYQEEIMSATSGPLHTATESAQRPDASQTTIRPVTRGGQAPSTTSDTAHAPLEFHPVAPSRAAPEEPLRFYQQPPHSAALYSPENEMPSSQPASTAGGSRPPRDPRSADSRSEVSYVSSISGSPETEFEIDPATGSIRHDAHGRPVVHVPRERRGTLETEESDDYDVEADVAREREHAAHYGTGRSLPATSAEAMATMTASTGPNSGTSPAAAAMDEVHRGQRQADHDAPDYSGEGYGSSWSGLREHHHPTRLSDVMEEEEERSRASHGSRH